MRRTATFRAVTLLTLLAFTSSCMTTQLPPISSAGGDFEPLPDEQALWEEARDEEKKLLEEADLYEDPLLEDYLEDVVSRLTPPGMAANEAVRYRVRVIEDPTLNAFAYPHGSLYVHTGLLARMENEDQIATVLGHEMTHVENRHMVRYRRSAMNKQIGLSVAAVAAAVILAGEQGDAMSRGQWGKAATIGVLGDVIVGLGLQLAFLASVNGYGRNLEHEADQGGFAKLAATGYDLQEAPKVYQALLEDRGEKPEVEAFFFGSRPQLTLRIENARKYLAAHPAAGDVSPAGDAEAFSRRIRPVVRDDARLNLEMGRLTLAEAQLEKVRQWMPDDPEAHYLTGRLHLAKSETAEAEKDAAAQAELRAAARESLRESIRLDPERPGPHRELGLLLHRGGELRDACRELRHYARLDPDADDAERVRDYIRDLERDGECPGE
ncbi:MAG TPA: M48 family metalloprotease [Thermoanaerobaculia bacterium]|nr:M48 family metalloprotease [Thermoanaerobaculia bacterium]